LTAQPLVSAPAPKTLANTRGTVLKVFGTRLLVGTAQGTVEGFDTITGSHAYTLHGETGSVRDIVSVNGRVWWVNQGSRVLNAVDNALAPARFDLSGNGLSSEIVRLTQWRGMVVAHTATSLRFIDARTGSVIMPAQVLPKAIAEVVAQGNVLTEWSGDRGMLFVVRRFGSHAKPPEEGGVRDIAMISGWSCDIAGRYRLLGHYTCAITPFTDAPGPNVRIDIGERRIENPFGSALLGNLKIGPEGVIALTKNQTLVVPFAKKNWSTTWKPLPIEPRYPQTVSFSSSNVWWWSDGRLVQANLEDGSCDVYTPRVRANEVRSIAADGEGAWVLTSAGVFQIKAEDAESLQRARFVHHELNGNPTLGFEQTRLAKLLASRAQVEGLARKRLPGLATMKALVEAAGIGPKKGVSAKRFQHAREVSDLDMGDVMLQNDDARLYLGNGKALAFRNGKSVEEPIDVEPNLRILRVLKSDGELMASRIGTSNLLSGIFPVGLGRPHPSLGYGLFVTVNRGGPNDVARRPIDYRLLSVIEGWIGTPYAWGGSTKEGCDCSGFVQAVFREMGVELPRHSQHMGRAPFGKVVTDELQFGDVLVFPSPKHVAIYIGNGQTAEAMRGGIGYGTIDRRRIAIVRRFL
jgi:hypothetical protein